MDRNEFINCYINRRNKVRMFFDELPFIHSSMTDTSQGQVSLSEILTYYVARYEKNGCLSKLGIEDQIMDPDTLPVSLGRASTDPAMWNLNAGNRLPIKLNKLDPVPVLTDGQSGKTLLLDSNHTLIDIIRRLRLSTATLTGLYFPVMQVVSNHPADITIDFVIVNRTSK